MLLFMITMIITGGYPAVFNFHFSLSSAAVGHQQYHAVGGHGDEVPRSCQHESKRIRLLRQVAERGIGVAQEMHKRSPEKHPAGELSSQEQKALVPPPEIRRDSAGERAHKQNDQTVNFHQDQPSPAEVNCGSLARVVAAAVAIDAGELNAQQEE